MTTSRTVVITGAAGGIGSELVDRFLANGDTVVAADVAQDALDAWRGRWDADAALHSVEVDITEEASVAALAQRVRDDHGSVDVLINAAGFFPPQPFEGMPVEDWRRVIDINLTGTFLVVQAIVPLMKDKGGKIINYGSGTVFVGTPMQAHYVAAKAGVQGLTRTLARELGQYGINVNVITPGLTVTPAATAVATPALLELQRNLRAFPRDEVPQDLVGPTFFLASDDAAFVTGQTLNVDGGRTLL